MEKIKIYENKLSIAILAFIASLGLNVDLTLLTSLDDFLIEGYPITRYQEVSGNLSDSMYIIANFFAGFSGNSVLWLCVFFALCLLFREAFSVKDARILKYSATTAVLFSLLYVIGFSINKYNSIIAITDSGTSLLKSLIAFIGISLIFHAVLSIFFDKVTRTDFSGNKTFFILEADKKGFFLRIVTIFLCWLPYLIVYLPGFFPRDTVGEIAQALGERPITAISPIFTTGLFGIFIKLGLSIGSANTGLLLYSLFQMLITSAAFSYVLHCMARHNFYLRIFTLLFFALYPVNAFYSITMWKDTLFSVVLMLITLKTIYMVSSPIDFFSHKKNLITYTLLCVALFLVRNNGLYIILLFLPTLMILMRKYWKNILIIICAFLMFFMSLQIISGMLNVSKGPIGEALSLPLQQIARTVKEHGDKLPDSDKKIIESILPFELLPELYNPTISDPIKGIGVFNEATFRSDISLYVSLWTRLFFKYPLTFIEAFLCHTHGYWYPDINYWLVAREMWSNNYGIHFIRIVPSFIDNVFSGIFVFRVFPVISMLISIGFAVWVTILAALVLILKRQYRFLIAFLPVILLWLTCIASPVSGMMRYIYGLILTLPILISTALQCEKWNEFRFER